MLPPKYTTIEYLLPLCLLFLCSGCSPPQIDAPVHSETKLQPSLPSLAGVSQAKMVEIQNDWNGYSDITPILRHYKLRCSNQELVGNAHFAVGGYGAANIHQQTTKKVKIPAGATQNFLATLAKTPIKLGKYKPLINHSDDYPSITIRVKVEGKEVTFSSQSQGKDHIPWKVAISSPDRTTEYISNSPIPAQALKLLNPYINNPGIDLIIQRKRK